MRKFAFIGRHVPSPEQHAMAAAQGVELVPVGDIDAFAFAPNTMPDLYRAGYEGIVTAHALIALIARRHGLAVGVFENGQRPGEGGPPTFFAKSFVIVD